MRKIRLIAIDLDGTLLDSQHKLGDENRRAIRQACGAGVHVLLATGRQYVVIEPYVAELGLDSPQITSSGAVITQPGSAEIVYAERIPRDAAEAVVRVARELGATLVVVQNGKTFTAAINADIEHMLSYGDPLPTVIPELAATLEVLPTNMKMIAYLQDDFFASAERVFQNQVGEQVNIFRSVPYYLEFSSKRASKGAALRRVADLLSVPAETIMAIGDGENDISMFQVAGLAVAMANASDAVKQHADMITSHCDDAGVARAIDQSVFGRS